MTNTPHFRGPAVAARPCQPEANTGQGGGSAVRICGRQGERLDGGQTPSRAPDHFALEGRLPHGGRGAREACIFRLSRTRPLEAPPPQRLVLPSCFTQPPQASLHTYQHLHRYVFPIYAAGTLPDRNPEAARTDAFARFPPPLHTVRAPSS